MTNQKQLYERLWAAAEQLRANGELKLNEIAEPILGLIFLKFADVKFRQAEKRNSRRARQSFRSSGAHHARPLQTAWRTVYSRDCRICASDEYARG